MPRKMKNKAVVPSEEPPTKRTKLFDEDAASDDDAVNLTINEEFAKRFEHNKKREEKQRLEEKYANEDSDEESSTDEDEDDAAELATADLDNEIFATLNAIKKKDPRVYDPEVTFYTPFEADQANDDGTKKEKPLYLADYHRQNLLNGNAEVDEEEDAPPQTYAQEQQALKDDLINQMHATAEEEADDEDDFLVKKPGQTRAANDAPRPQITERDIQVADKDPETFLSNFMQSRAWVPDEKSRFDAFDSDDSEDERRAEMFEDAYNMRFEDPTKANEKLMTFSRDVAKLSARREEKSGRKKQREKEREKKEAIKRERTEEKARLRKLKIDEVEEKVKKIKEAAGLKNQALDLGEWKQVLDEDWDDDHWEQEMKRRFGDNYYSEKDAIVEDDADEEEEEDADKTKKPHKPKWDDDIDINDLVPEFDEEAEAAKLRGELAGSDEEEDDAEDNADEDDDNIIAPDGVQRKTKKDRLKEAADKRRVARKERMAIEELVDADLTGDLPVSTKASGFRYRETSPTSFGLTARDILFADDTALNEYAGLKKLATWRDEDKKKKDKKKLGKKARLRQWRKETFGTEEGFTGGFKEFLGEEAPAQSSAGAEGGSRKRRGKKRKAEA
ncbi:Krr1-domain-containing protein [Aureobasidium pullulans]|nr:Krr1-domain-containing protein [Aureobasidium pullulans]TIA24343.1 Krr1-domain-containing protein [Aureobasidium pullulans]